jgi:hypothetical protein
LVNRHAFQEQHVSENTLYLGKKTFYYRERLTELAEENNRTIAGELATALDCYFALAEEPPEPELAPAE